MDKKGMTTFSIILGIILVFVLLIFVIILGIASTHFNSALNQNISIGQVNLKTVNAETVGQLNYAIVNHADFWGLCIIFGMVMALFLVSYMTRNQWPKITVIIDLGMIFGSFLLSLYIRAAYSTVVTSLSSAGENFAVNNLQHTNFFILNLPIFVAVIGAIMMILFHSAIPLKPDELNYTPNVVTG